jgi:hypothetical protein
MTMLIQDLASDSMDDPDFLEHASRIISGAAEIHRPRDVRVFKIDNWFDHKWLAFSGKRIGAVGIWYTQEFLTIPPFVQNRIVDQGQYVRDEASGRYDCMGGGANIHHRGWSAGNLQRRVTRIVPDAALFWYSGNSATTGRGSLMGYLPLDQDLCRDHSLSGPHIRRWEEKFSLDCEHWVWFLAFVRETGWKVARRRNIQAHEVGMLERAAERSVITQP